MCLYTIFIAPIDFDLENNPEFLEFIQKNNPTTETLQYMRNEIQKEINQAFQNLNKVSMHCINHLKQQQNVHLPLSF